MMPTPAPGRGAERYRFDRFELQPAARRLLAEGRDARVGARAFDVLLALVERPGRVVAKDELLAAVWPGVIVEEANLAVQISALRKVLGPGLIATVAGRGYQFTGTLEPLAAGSEAEAAPAAAPLARGGVPRAATPIIGREAELAALAGLLATHRLVTLAGAGGIGKTRLAMAWCEGPGLGEPIVWIDLSALDDASQLSASQLAASVLARLQAAGMAATASAPGTATALDLLCQAIAARTLTLVLDNAEPVAGEAAALAQALLDAAPRLRLLVTSQVPLRLQAEQVFRLGTLPVPPGRATPAQALAHAAVALFVERARAADPQFELASGNVTSVVEICRRLDGLPLALELAAARVATVGVNALAAALGAALDAAGGASSPLERDAADAADAAAQAPPGVRLGVLGEGPRDAPARQRTLRAALGWSHALLDASAQRVFRRLGVFSGGFTLAAAQAVVGDGPQADAAGAAGAPEAANSVHAASPADAAPLDDWAVMSALGRLVEHSLVAKDGAEPPRFSLLESARLFALEQLERAREAPARRARHLAWCVAFVRQVAGPPIDVGAPAGRGTAAAPFDDRRAARIAVEYGNLRAALAFALAPGSPHREAGAALATALLPYWRHIDAADEQRRWLASPAPQAAAAGLDAATVMALATRVSREPLPTFESAVDALKRAVALAADLLGGDGAGAAAASEAARLKAFVDGALEDAARQARAGHFDHGAGVLDDALAELGRREASQQEHLRRARRALLEAGVQADLERRDVAAAARRITALATLDRPEAPTDAPSFREREAALLAAGLQQRDPVSLAVAAQLLRQRLQAAQATAAAPGAGGDGSDELRQARFSLAQALNRLGAADPRQADHEAVLRLCRDALATTSRAAHPLDWAALQHELAFAQARLGERGGDPALLAEAAAACRLAMQELTKERSPQAWIDSTMLLAQVERRAGTIAGDPVRLEAAVQVARAGLRVLSRAEDGAKWASLQGIAAGALGELARHEGSIARRHEAVAAYRAALGELTPERTPHEWAAAQCNLGIELAALGGADPGPAGIEWLQGAVDAYRAALRILSLEASPTGWAAAQHNLGGTLRLLGERESGTQSLREAVLAFDEALRHHTRERAPGHWAAGQNDRALALVALGRRERRPEPLRQAVAALRDAVLERRRESTPLVWATMQMSLAEALTALAEIDDDTAAMQDAVRAVEAALEELTPERSPKEHAEAASHLAVARAWLARRSGAAGDGRDG